MKNLLFGVSSTDPLTFLGITLLLAAVALFACWITRTAGNESGSAGCAALRVTQR